MAEFNVLPFGVIGLEVWARPHRPRRPLNFGRVVYHTLKASNPSSPKAPNPEALRPPKFETGDQPATHVRGDFLSVLSFKSSFLDS